MRSSWLVFLAWGVLGFAAALRADEIKTSPAPPPATTPIETTPAPRTREPIDAPPLGDTGWNVLDPTIVDHEPDRSPSGPQPVGPSRILPFVAVCGAILLGGLLLALSFRRWRSSDVARYLERTGTPWGRREDLFVEKLVLELRVLRAGELTRQLALQERFGDLDKVERPLRKLRARYRAVRREYRHIAVRIGPVSDSVRHECAQAVRRSGLVQAAVLSPQETEAIQRLSLEIERKKRALQPTP